MSYRKTILVDFDAVLSQYSGWKGPEDVGEPIEKARHACCLLAKEFRLVCFTTRQASVVERWLRLHAFPTMRVTNLKEPASLQIDDRAMCFDGQWTDEFIERIRAFKPYWEKKDV